MHANGECVRASAAMADSAAGHGGRGISTGAPFSGTRLCSDKRCVCGGGDGGGDAPNVAARANGEARAAIVGAGSLGAQKTACGGEAGQGSGPQSAEPLVGEHAGVLQKSGGALEDEVSSRPEDGIGRAADTGAGASQTQRARARGAPRGAAAVDAGYPEMRWPIGHAYTLLAADTITSSPAALNATHDTARSKLHVAMRMPVRASQSAAERSSDPEASSQESAGWKAAVQGVR